MEIFQTFVFHAIEVGDDFYLQRSKKGKSNYLFKGFALKFNLYVFFLMFLTVKAPFLKCN